jgi:geranylgeranyl pyrophosphate synthase
MKAEQFIRKYGQVRSKIFNVMEESVADKPPRFKDACLLSMHRGKCLRGIMSFMSSMLTDSSSLPYKKKVDKAIVLGAMPEVYHLSSLIHDDTVDKSETRRGSPSVWGKYGAGVATVVGDFWIFNDIILRLMNYVPFAKLNEVPKEIIGVGQEMSIGELYDAGFVDFENDGNGKNEDVYTKKYLETISMKTIPLIRASATIPASVNEANDLEKTMLRAYANYTGVLFQIRDDMIDIIGNEKLAGKPLIHNVDIGSNFIISRYFDRFGTMDVEEVYYLRERKLSKQMKVCLLDAEKIIKRSMKKAIAYLDVFEDDRYIRGLKDVAIVSGTRER